MSRLGILFTALLTISQTAFGASLGPYGGIQYSSIEDDENADLGVLNARLGTFMTENLSVEARIGTGISDHSEEVAGVKATVEADTVVGAYLRGGIFITPTLYPYLIVGYTQFDYTISAQGFGSMSDDESGTSLGLGAEFFLSKNAGITLEVMRLLDEDDVELDSTSLGIVLRF